MTNSIRLLAAIMSLTAYVSIKRFYLCVCVFICVNAIHSKIRCFLFRLLAPAKRDAFGFLHSFRFCNVLLFSYFSFLLLESIVWPYYCSAFSIAILPFTRIGHIFLNSRSHCSNTYVINKCFARIKIYRSRNEL